MLHQAKAEQNLNIKSQMIFTGVSVILATCFQLIMWKNSSDIVKTTNGLIQLEQQMQRSWSTRLPSRNGSYARKFETLMIHGFILTEAVLGLSPCVKATMGSNFFLFWEETSSASVKFIMRIANVFAWYVVACFVFMIVESYLALASINVNLLCCKQGIQNGWKTHHLLNCLQKMQLLIESFNGAHSSFLVLLLMGICIAQVISCYVIVAFFNIKTQVDDAQYGKNHSISMLLLNLVVFVQAGLVTLTTFGIAGNVFATSHDVKRKIDRLPDVVGNRRNKRIARSIPSMKIRFGSSNFVDKFTPLVFTNFNMARAIDLILIDRVT